MKSNVFFFPVLADIDASALNPVISYGFHVFSDQNVKVDIDYLIEENFIKLSIPEKLDNDVKELDLFIDVDVDLSNASILYGENGIAPMGSSLYLGIEFFSTVDKFRGIWNSANQSIQALNNPQHFHFSGHIKKNTYSSNICLNTLIYLGSKSNSVNSNESHLNNDEGVLLGNLSHKEICISLDKSLFPIYKKSLNTNELWLCEISYDDPEIDEFLTSFRIILNTKHKDFKYIDKDSIAYCERLLLEIVAAAICCLIEKIKEEDKWDDILNNENIVEGSILDALKCIRKRTPLDGDISNMIPKLSQYLSEDRVYGI